MTEAGKPELVLEEAQRNALSEGSPTGVSPYSTGGGGVTFERKVAVTYLAHLLIGDGSTELGDERRVVSVAFQQAPDHPVDDLVVMAARADETEPSLVLALGIRRAPNLVKSDVPTQKLIRDFVQAVINAPTDGPEYRVALVVAGPQDHARQLASLTDLAAGQVDAPAFFNLVLTPNKSSAALRGRLNQVKGLVEHALLDLGSIKPDAALVQQRTWELLSRLTVLMPRLEAPDEADWATVINSLMPVGLSGDLAGAARLRDRLVALADEYAPKAATVDLTMLRRDAHTTLDTSIRRNQQGWKVLRHLNKTTMLSVRNEIAASDSVRRVHLDRRDIGKPLIAAAKTGTAVIAHGESGVGKSALIVDAANSLATDNPDAAQVVCINLRYLPSKTVEFESLLGCPLEVLLAELSAPQRLLVIDGADAVAEGGQEQLRYLTDAALKAGTGVIAITTDDNKQVVSGILRERFGSNIVESAVPGLTDAEIDEVVGVFGELVNLGANPRSRELLHRPVVIDLLMRGGIAGVPLSDADAMQQVWDRLVRRSGQADRGTPDARNLAMLRLADLALSGGDHLAAVGTIDPAALEGLRRDGLLRDSIDDPFKIGPEFAHDEIRRYAVARLLLAGAGPTTKLAEVGVPRWTLGAARLACQAQLGAPDTPVNPLRGRFTRLQEAFDALVNTGHGERWGDVPSEALLTIGDPEPVLRDAWEALRTHRDKGLLRFSRLVDQRLRHGNGFVDIVAVEPLVKLLLEEETPWRSGKRIQGLLRDWLRAHVIASTPTGHSLRIRLSERLVAACAAADRRVEQEHAATLAARSPEEERQFRERHRSLLPRSGNPSRRRRQRPEVPREITNEIVIELLALLGPDLDDDGAAILQRVGRDAPSNLAPAIEEYLTGRALAAYRRGLLAELTEAYYINDEEDGSGFREDCIREHHSRSVPLTPFAAWYRGPFIALFQDDLIGGVSVLNRMLNRAAVARARILVGLDRGYSAPISADNLDHYRTELDITDKSRTYVGDDSVWNWYRGTGVGPYPCMSALQALERVCDQLIEAGILIENMIAILLNGCENLAMVGFVVGLLVRHAERTGRLLDPFIADPRIWRLEFARASSELFSSAASSDGIFEAERRSWSMRDAAMTLLINADDARASELHGIGEQLVENARRLIVGTSNDGGEPAGDTGLEQELAKVRAWASVLDRSTYRAVRTDAGMYAQSMPPAEVVQALQRGSAELQRAQEAMQLALNYGIKRRKEKAENLPADEVIADLSRARDLLGSPNEHTPTEYWNAVTAVAAAALSAHLLHGAAFKDDLLVFAVDIVLRVGVDEASPRWHESEESYYEQGADRSAARALPLLLLPSATPLLALVDGADSSSTYDRVIAAIVRLAHAVPLEVRLHLMYGLDQAWQVSCTPGEECHHETALQLVIESMRDSALGDWNPDTGQRQTALLEEPVEASLAEVPAKSIRISHLDAAIRALAPAAAAQICVSARAREALDIALAAQRRSLLAYDRDMDPRDTHALVAARAVLILAVNGDDAPILEHIDAFAGSAPLLGGFLRALSSAAEESAERAEVARRLWPEVIKRVLVLHKSDLTPFNDNIFGHRALAALLPNEAGENSYLYQELDGNPILWWEPLQWREVVDQWLPLAAGNPICVDQLISFLSLLTIEDQGRHGLEWVAALVLADPGVIVGRSYLLSEWLISIRSAASDAGLLPDWQRLVDTLVVAGDSRLALYSE